MMLFDEVVGKKWFSREIMRRRYEDLSLSLCLSLSLEKK